LLSTSRRQRQLCIRDRYSYNVVAVYDTGLSAGSNTASVEISGIGMVSDKTAFRVVEGGIELLATGGLDASVAGVNGIVYYAGVPESAVTVKLASGVYMVKIGRKVYKVNVK
ncbi:MAG: hypothetical protein K2G23_02810, partial [Muribaculaceae bacterium]|nr:hypothetical protein [Muribaculaceae bacterium]